MKKLLEAIFSIKSLKSLFLVISKNIESVGIALRHDIKALFSFYDDLLSLSQNKCRYGIRIDQTFSSLTRFVKK
jgi:hypothetical protein